MEKPWPLRRLRGFYMTKMKSFVSYLELWNRERREKIMEQATEAKIQAALERDHLQLEDFLLLLHEKALPFLEHMARRAQGEALRHFGRAVHLFTPLYLSDYCTNQCRYCGFNAKNKHNRRHLSLEEAEAEAKSIAATGLGHILLLTGDARKISSPEYIGQVAKRIKPYFASIGIEVYAMSVEEYAMLVNQGVDSMTLFQETYNEELYAYLHPKGPKSDFSYRLHAPERAVDGGMHSINVGALLGLDKLEHDGFCTALHAWWLQRHEAGVEVAVSVPRMCPHEGNFAVPHTLDDKRFVQYITALRCFLPRIGITVSSRESAYMRDHIVPLGVTRVSAGVSTIVGGRATESGTTGQFEISDERSAAQMTEALAKAGYQAVCKDWQNAHVQSL